jgi:hypothetical protein
LSSVSSVFMLARKGPFSAVGVKAPFKATQVV